MRLGLIGRADRGGLGALTWEFHRHVQPERVLGIDLGQRGRGPADWSRYPGAVVNQGMDSDLPADRIRSFCHGMDVVYTAETFYRADFADIARSVGCRTVLHAMPELWRSDHARPDVVWAPTTWALDRLPEGVPVVPVPVARGRLPFTQREEGRVLYHCGAPAMLDRNGTRLLHDALRLVRHPCRLIVASSAMRWPTNIGRVTIEELPAAANYFDVHPHEADVLIMPRRYAGLSLPLQECASMGMAVITLDLEPQRQWVAPPGLVPAFPVRKTAFPGGEFIVHGCTPSHLAAVINAFLEDAAMVKGSSAVSDMHADSISWDRWAPQYADLLDRAAA